MKQVHVMLAEGNGHAACDRCATLLAQQPDQAPQAADIITSILWTNYEQLHVQAVHDFCRDATLQLPPAVAQRVDQALGPKLARTEHWIGLLRGVTQERLVRECRNLVVLRDLKGAAARARALLERAADEAELDDYCQYLARGLAELTHDHDRCLSVIGLVMKAGGQAGMGAGLVASHFTQMSREFTATHFQTGDQEWTRNQTDALLTLREYFPGPNEVGAPEPAQLEKLYDELHAVMRAGMARHSPDDFIDALWIISDYCPADPAPIRNASGVEDRMFINLGPRAKLTAVRATAQLGEIEPLRATIVRLAQAGGIYNHVRLMSAIMGGLRRPEFFPYLSRALDKAANDAEERLLVEALGRLGNPEAVGFLLGRLAEAVKIKAKPRQAERIETLLTAFGRISRQPGQDPAFRNELTLKVMKAVGSADRHISFRTAELLFSNRLEELRPELKAWAAEKTVEALWGQPLRQETGEQVNPNGWREPMVNELVRLGPEMLPIVLLAATRHASAYGGAMSALARALEQIGDERAVPVLETMLRTALLYREDDKRSHLLDEKVRDAATGQMQDLDRDDVVHTLLYTLLRIGGDAGLKIVLTLADQVQAGRVESPGQQTINLLVDTKVKHGRLNQVEHEIQEAAEVDEKTFKAALSDARGGLLTKRATRISAIAALGGARRLQAISVLLDALGDKDALVASAAHTALAQYLLPVPNEKAFCEFLAALFEREGALKGRLLERLLEFIRREVPKNPPYDKLFDRQVEIDIEDGAVAHQFRGAMLRSMPAGTEGTEESEGEGAYVAAARGPMSDLEKKRAYLQARREWIARGKVGDPPAPPS